MSTMSDRNSLSDRIYDVLREEIPDAKYTEVIKLTNKIGIIVSKWCPKKGDFWLNEDDGFFYVNKGWEIVTAEVPE